MLYIYIYANFNSLILQCRLACTLRLNVAKFICILVVGATFYLSWYFKIGILMLYFVGNLISFFALAFWGNTVMCASHTFYYYVYTIRNYYATSCCNSVKKYMYSNKINYT